MHKKMHKVKNIGKKDKLDGLVIKYSSIISMPENQNDKIGNIGNGHKKENHKGIIVL